MLRPTTAGDRRASVVAIAETMPAYPAEPPYHPSEAYPERLFGDVGDASPANGAYAAVRQLFRLLGFDASRYGTPAWNPLGCVIRPGDRVLVKPNLVLHLNHLGHDLTSVVTHAAVLRPILDFVLIALDGRGSVVVGDAPLQSCNFDQVVARSGVGPLVQFYRSRGFPVELRDFRLVTSRDGLYPEPRRTAAGDQAGFAVVDLGPASCHHGADWERFRVTNYDPGFMARHHSEGHHQYVVARSILDADVVINVPKLKTHRKVGMTCCLKNLVGINGHKDCLPHHKRGSVGERGDEYLHRSLAKDLHVSVVEAQDRSESSLLRLALQLPKALTHALARSLARDRFFEGSWYGNDTLWRTLVDLNRILYYWDLDRGALSDHAQRRVMCVVDAVVAGEGEGPLAPTPRPTGLVLAGANPAAVDATCARLIGFDHRKIPAIAEARSALPALAFDLVEIATDAARWGGLELDTPGPSLAFRPAAGWKGHIELDPARRAALAA
jgi:uncharacterized protein (DUF362 family)